MEHEQIRRPGTVAADQAEDVSREGQGYGAQLHNAHRVSWCTQLEIALGPSLQQH